MKRLFKGFLLLCLAALMAACDNENIQQENDGDKIQISLLFSIGNTPLSIGEPMTGTKGSGEGLFDAIYQGIVSGEIIASYELTFKNINTGVSNSISGKWTDNKTISLEKGTYTIYGISTAVGKGIYKDCSLSYQDEVTITPETRSITIKAQYDCSLLIVNDDSVDKILYYASQTDYTYFSQYRNLTYAFVKSAEDFTQGDNAFLKVYFKNGKSSIVNLGQINIQKGKYYLLENLNNYADAGLVLDIDKMENGTNSINSPILGTWRMIGEEYHPAIATFKSNGEYEWEWGGITGLKDNGTYTYKDGVITMTIKERWECETSWKDQQIVHGDWTKVTDFDPEDPTTRVCTVFTVQESYLIWNFGGDYFWLPNNEYGHTEYNAVIFMLNDKFQEPNINISPDLVKGEWISTDSEGNLDGRIIIEGNNYTAYSAYPLSIQDESGEWISVLTSNKFTGTYRFDRGFFMVTLNKYESSYEYKGYHMQTGRSIYEYSTVNPNTLEAEEWIVSQEQGDILKVMVYVYNNRLFFQQQYDPEAKVYKKK